jgi:diguanylate cyclase (GGDEF)-like protein
VVLASLLYAGAVQIDARNQEIASYLVGRSAVRLVERLRDVSAAVTAYAPSDDAAVTAARVGAVRIALAAADRELQMGGLGYLPDVALAPLIDAWQAVRAPGPALVRSTAMALREATLSVGTTAVARGSATTADAPLAAASLLALPGASAQFQRLANLITAASPEHLPDRFTGAALAALYSDVRTASDIALESAWIEGLPSSVRLQAEDARTSATAFLDLLRLHVTRGDALQSRSVLLGPATATAVKLTALESTLLPLLEGRLAAAGDRAHREIVIIVGLVAAIMAMVGVLLLQVVRAQLRSQRARAAFQHQALHDALTGLPNRRAFAQSAAEAVAAWTPVNDRTSWVLSIDLDYFKEVNDRYGHQTGDGFLAAATQRIRAAVPPGELLARVGGDEFAVLVHHYDPDSTHGLNVGMQIVEAFEAPITVEGVEHRLAASIGVVAVDALHETVDSVLRDADIAMYRAKDEGGARVVLFDDVLRQEIVERAELAGDLRADLERDTGPRVVFQPIVSLEDGTCHGFEALVRWFHPVHGEIGAELLVAVAQEARLIVPLGRRVVQEVCRHLDAWRTDGLPLEALQIHINISPMEATQLDTYASLADAIDTWAIPPQTLVIELTETASIASAETAGRVLAALNAMGVRVCLDDFGTGYSSLRHLNDFHIDALKIDRSFVVSAAADPAKIPIVAGIIALARGLNAEVIAEGIETNEQRQLIDDLGCTLVQGYLFGRPMPPDDAFRFASRTLAAAARK